MIPFEVVLAIIAPVLGGLVGILRKPRVSLVYHLLAFAGGIMLAISFFDLIPESVIHGGYLISIFGITIGFFTMFLVHLIIPSDQSLKETASFLAIGMGVHNLAEGMAIAIASNLSQSLNFIVVASIVIHDFAEGLCTATPLYYSSKKRGSAFAITVISALPLLVGFLIIELLFSAISDRTLGFLLGAVAGMMLNITLGELVPQSAHKSTGYATEFSLMIGIIVVMLLRYL